MTIDQSRQGTADIADILRRLDTLEAEADIRRLQARYMFLCDTPCPEFGVENDRQRVDLIMDLYSDDAVWEGVGSFYDGSSAGRKARRRSVSISNASGVKSAILPCSSMFIT